MARNNKNEELRNEFEGKIFRSNNDGNFTVLEYENAHNVLIRFNNTGYENWIELGQVRNGQVKDRLVSSVCNVGYLGDGPYTAGGGSAGASTPSYEAWVSLIKRNYSAHYVADKPGFRQRKVCDEWLNYQNFAEYYYENVFEGATFRVNRNTEGSEEITPDNCSFVVYGVT